MDVIHLNTHRRHRVQGFEKKYRYIMACGREFFWLDWATNDPNQTTCRDCQREIERVQRKGKRQHA